MYQCFDFDSNENKLGIIPGSDLTFTDTEASFNIDCFGSYQLVKTKKTISQEVEVKNTDPILSARNGGNFFASIKRKIIAGIGLTGGGNLEDDITSALRTLEFKLVLTQRPPLQ